MTIVRLRLLLIAALGPILAATVIASLAPAGKPAWDADDPLVYSLTGAARPIADGPVDAQWFDTEWGWIVVPPGADAGAAADDVRAAVAAFYVHFGVSPQRGAIVDRRYANAYTGLSHAGAAWQTLLVDAHGGAESGRPVDAHAALRHEIAHTLFLSLVIGNTRGGQYGGDAADWLDEAAAMIAETPEATRLRRTRFATLVAEGRVPRFMQTITVSHPLYGVPAVAQALARATTDRTHVAVALTASETGIGAARIADFYANARAAADYLIERSGDRRILARVAAIVRARGDATSWIAELHARGVWPVPPERIDDDFARWAALRG